jgi:plasmid stability protein
LQGCREAAADEEHGMASLVVGRWSDATNERLRQRAARHRWSLEAVRAILERAAQATAAPSAEAERFPD